MNKPFAVTGATFVSPKGKALWCKVTEPDRKFDPEGTLSTSLVLNPESPDVKAFIESLEELQDKAYTETVESLGAKGSQVRKRPIYTAHVDQNGNQTGNIVFKFALKNVDARKAKGSPHTIGVVDSQKQPVHPVPLVGNDSTIRVASYVYPYYMAMSKEIGLSMMWTKMQIIDLVSYAVDEFDAEDGFTAEAASPESFGEDDF